MEAEIRTRPFCPENESGFKEYHSFVRIPEQGSTYEEQKDAIVSAIAHLSDSQYIRFVRIFLSDASNQQPVIAEAFRPFPFPVSYVQQPPLDGTKIAAWVYSTDAGAFPEMVWNAYMTSCDEGPLAQMYGIFTNYGDTLRAKDMTVAQDCIRTWIFVHDVDVNYVGVVRGRRDYFNTIGLAADTHFIASTGIEGRHANPSTLVTMDALAFQGIAPERIQYLHAKDHLNATAEYGVTFERGTAVHFDDRIHAYISGTASIDSKGNVLYPGDVSKQTLRLLENIAALLSEASSKLEDIAMAIVYLRDTADYPTVKSLIEEQCPGINAEFVLAPVCRPAWLVEMECIAIRQA